jgi:hypothetical protein
MSAEWQMLAKQDERLLRNVAAQQPNITRGRIIRIATLRYQIVLQQVTSFPTGRAFRANAWLSYWFPRS